MTGIAVAGHHRRRTWGPGVAMVVGVALSGTCLAQTHAQHENHGQYGQHAQHSQPGEHGQHAGDSQHHDHPASDGATRREPGESERRHVPPPPPERVMRDMSAREMIELMGMDDAAPHGLLLLDQAEWRSGGDGSFAWSGDAWFGGDYDKAWLEFEGEREEGHTEARYELLWDRVIARWWSLQSGVRRDAGGGPGRTWAAVGVQGLAPQWFEVEATLYLGEQGRTAARLSAEYDLLLTQRLVLQPEAELSVFGKSDPARRLGSGLSDLHLGLRLRYEIRREFAPYLGVSWGRLFGGTASLARATGEDVDDLQIVLGVRAWY